MKKFLAMFLLLILLTIRFIDMNVSTAYAAGTILKIYNQREYSSYTMSGGYSLSSSGCGIFMTAHAIQWLTGNNPPITTVKDRCGNTVSSYSTASTYLKNQYDIQYSSQTKTESAVKTTLDSNGVISHHGWGHYILAVDYKVVNGITYLHIIDSSTGTTVRCIQGNVYRFSDMYETKNYADICTYYGNGSQYWIKCSDFIDRSKWIYSSGDLAGQVCKSLTLDKLVAPVETEFTCMAKFNKDDEVRVGPLEASDLVRNYSTGSIVRIIASVVNSYGNTWYKTSDGYYVYSGDVQIVEESDDVTWDDWGEWTTTRRTDIDPNLIQEDVKQRYKWWCAKCKKCGTSNRYWGSTTKCTSCGQTLPKTNITDVVKYTDDAGSSNESRTIDGTKVWYTGETVTFYRYRNKIIVPTAISLNKTSMTINIGSSEMLEVTITPSNAADQSMTWVSSNPDVATVDNAGWVTAITEGTATITVRTNVGNAYSDWGAWSKWSSSRNTVTDTNLMQEESASKAHWWAAKCKTCGRHNPYWGTTTKCVSCGSYLPSSNVTHMNYYSDDTSGSNIDDRNNGRTYEGNTYWYCDENTTVYRYRTRSITDSDIWTSCIVYVVDPVIHPTAVTLNQTSMTLNVGASETLIATISPSNATEKDVTWQSSNPSVVTVDNGIVTAIDTGMATITVITNDGGKAATCDVTVKVPPMSVTLNKTSLTINVGESETLIATVEPSNATDKSVAWSSNNTSVATVDSTGKVTAVSAGNATITVTTNDGGKTATCAVMVKVPPTDVMLNKTSLTLYIGESETLIATVEPSNATDKSVAWSSSNTSVATVDSTGKVTAGAAGSATITVTTNDGGKTATCDVTVKVPPTDVMLNKTSLTLDVGSNETLIATVVPSDATDKSVAWSSDNTAVATVDSTGKVTAVSSGKAVITVTTNDGGKTATCTVNVNYIQPIIQASLELLTKKSETLTVQFMPAAANPPSVTWTSSNTAVATVDSTGRVTGKAVGTAVITATTNDGGLQATCQVTVKDPYHTPDFTLPSATATIEEEAFSWIAARLVKLPEGCTKIGSLAFANCPNLKAIYIPESCTGIASNAFSGVSGLVIYGADGSYAEFYAGKYGFTFIAVE